MHCQSTADRYCSQLSSHLTLLTRNHFGTCRRGSNAPPHDKDRILFSIYADWLFRTILPGTVRWSRPSANKGCTANRFSSHPFFPGNVVVVIARQLTVPPSTLSCSSCIHSPMDSLWLDIRCSLSNVFSVLRTSLSCEDETWGISRDRNWHTSADLGI